VTATNAANRDYAQPVFSALDGSRAFRQVSNGFAGRASDGLTQLDASHRLTDTFAQIGKGNLVQTAHVDLTAGARSLSRSASARPRTPPSAPPAARCAPTATRSRRRTGAAGTATTPGSSPRAARPASRGPTGPRSSTSTP
jgi:glucoamylase